MIAEYAPGYKRFVEPDFTAYGAYGHRWENDLNFKSQSICTNAPCKSQIEQVIETLHLHPDTRQAIVTMWNAGDLVHSTLLDKKDLPCTLSIQFYRYAECGIEKLGCITTMRSNDIWYGLPYDVFCFTSLQRLIAWELGIIAGDYTHQVGDLHIYDRDSVKVDSFPSYNEEVGAVPHGYPSKRNYTRALYLPGQIDLALKVEETARKRKMLDTECLAMLLNPILKDAALVCASKWVSVSGVLKHISSGFYRETLRRKYEG